MTIKLFYENYSWLKTKDYVHHLDGDLPNGIKEISVSFDGGRTNAIIDGEEIADSAEDYELRVEYKGISIHTHLGRFYYSDSNGNAYDDLGAGNDFSFTISQGK